MIELLLSPEVWIAFFTLAALEQVLGIDNIILIAGGLFLIWKSTGEVHQLLEGEEGGESRKVAASFAGVLMVQKWEAPYSAKHPSGAAAKLLQVIERKGVEAIAI